MSSCPLYFTMACFLRANRREQRAADGHGNATLSRSERLQPVDDALGDGAALRRKVTDRSEEVRSQVPAAVRQVADLAHLAQRPAVVTEERGRDNRAGSHRGRA